MKDLELAELRMPLGNALGPQIIYERLPAGSCAHGEKRAQVLIEEIPFLLETVESAVRFFLEGLLYREEIFVCEFLRGHERFLRREMWEARREERRKRWKVESGKWTMQMITTNFALSSLADFLLLTFSTTPILPLIS
jgi:hypothetical protein